MAQVHVRADDAGVAWLTLDNPGKLNAMSLEMWRTLGEALTRFEHDAAVRCVVITGQGDKAFCAGADISQFEKVRSGPESSAEYERITRGTLNQVKDYPKPTIAMIAGFCLGGGMGLAASCDLRLAATGSRLGIPAARLGIGYNYAGLKRLTELVGPAQAKRLLFSGDRFEAEEMLRIGFLDELHAPQDLLPRVQALTARIASNAPLSIAAAKAAIDVACTGAASAEAMAACRANEEACIASEDYAEGRRAFMEKRVPVFRGR